MSHEDQDPGGIGTLPPPEELQPAAEASPAEQTYHELHGDTFRFLHNTMSNNVSELAATAIGKTIERPLRGLEYGLERTESKPDEQERIVRLEESKARGLNKLAHAISRSLDDKRPNGYEPPIVLSRVPKREHRRSTESYRTGEYYENDGEHDAYSAMDMLYKVMGAERPTVIGPKVTDESLETLSDKRREEISKHDSQQPENVKIRRNIKTGEIEQISTVTPFGVTIVEQWGSSESLQRRSFPDHRDLGTVPAVEHSVYFEKTKEGADNVALDSIANSGEMSQEAESLRGHIDNLSEHTRAKAEELTEEHLKLKKKSESKLRFRRPSEQELSIAGVAADRARTSQAVMDEIDRIQLYGFHAPERLTEGVSIQLTELAPPAERYSRTPNKETITSSLEIRSLEDGTLAIKISEEQPEVDSEAREEHYEINADGDLFSVSTLDNGEIVRTQMEGIQQEAQLSLLYAEDEQEIPEVYRGYRGASNELLDKVRRFVGLTNPTVIISERVEDDSVKEVKVLPLHKDGAYDQAEAATGNPEEVYY